MKKRVILSIIAISLIVACGTKVAEIKDSLTKPLSPIELKVDSSTDTTVTLSWSAANTATSLLTTGYTVESATSEDFTKNSTKTTATETTATVKNLIKGTTYYFRVVADNSKADLSSAPSDVVSRVVGTAEGDGGTPSSSAAKPVVENVNLEKEGNGNVTLTWTSKDGKNDDGTGADVTEFLVRTAATEAGLSSATPLKIDANTFTYTITMNLIVGTTYWASVQAVTANSNATFANSDVVVKSYTEPAVVPTVPEKQQYSITINFNWNTGNNTSSFGPVPSSAHFSPVVVSVHLNEASIYKTGTLASQGIKQMAETGATSSLLSEIDAQIAAGNAYSKIRGNGGPGTGTVAIGNIEAKDAHHFLSLVSMIAPSPDWFIASRNIDLKESDGSWKDQIIIQMHGYDSGTDSGATFTASNQATNPAEDVFIFPSPDDIVFATLTINKL